jgi:glycerate-2-kinase
MTNKFALSRFEPFSIRSHPQRDFIQQVLASTFDSVNPYEVVKNYLQNNPLPFAKKIYAFGLGKAAIAMTQAVGDEISLTNTLVITKHASPLDLEPATAFKREMPQFILYLN